MGKTVDAVNETIEEGVRRGIIDRSLHAAPISVMLGIAETIDTPGFPIIDDRYDNVSIPTLLKYLQSLGLMAQEPKPERNGKAGRDGLDAMRAKFHAVG